MTRWADCAIQLLAALAAVGCSADPLPLTEMMVVVDSNIAEVDSVRVRVEGMGEPKVATAENLGQHPLPRTVAVVHRGGPLGPIEITAEALAGEATLVSRRAQVSFVRGRTLTLSLDLDQSCVGMQCDAAAETCIAGSCESAKVDSADLSEWSGKSLQRDAGEAGNDAAGAGSTGSSGAGTGAGGQAGARTGGQGGQAAGAGGAKSEAGGGGSSMQAACTGCKFDSAGLAPHGTLTCDTGTCLLSCDAGYIDADQVRGNGCEKAYPFPWKVSNVDPSNPSLMAALAPALTIDCSSTLDLDNVTSMSKVGICSQQLQPFILPQGGGAPDLVVFATRNLSVTAGGTLRFTGSRPVAILVYGDAVIDGQFDASAIGSTGGAGSNFECNPGAGGNGVSAKHSGGGGGGGFGSKGGDGGNGVEDTSEPPGQGGPGGAASADATLWPLRGGCSGGLGGKGAGVTAPGGGGGGALQISVAGKLRLAGTIAAAGGGGQPGNEFGDGGGGGGSGGAILLEATNIETVSGAWLTANGGGGGEGRVLNNPSNAGADGLHSSIDVAVGGDGASSGGNGAAGQTPATAAPACSAQLCGGGGGGGGIGRIVLRSDDCLLGGSTTPSTICTSHLN